ncbi:MAG: DNA polymerase III subunit delta [Bacteroidetes bacterium]|nr:DNA polymerase III subunit delta [Bacteroidota bacterium]
MAAPKNAVSFEKILLDLKNRIYSPVYFLYGEESFFIDQISDYIEENVLSEIEKEFNQTIIYGKDTDVPTVISYARRFPMMSNYQVIIIKEAQNLDKIEDLDPYVLNPMESTLLVIGYKYEKIDRRKSLYKNIEKKGILFESARIYDNKIPDWIAEYVRKQDYTISAKACFLLAEFLGNDISKIVNEISKLIINISAGQEITEEFVEKNIGISKDFNVFELQKALGKKDILKANQIINYFAANPRENPLVKIIPLLFSFFSKILVYHHLQDKSRNNVAAALSINPFFVTDYQQAASSYKSSKVVAIISVLREYDLKAKGVDSSSTSFSDGELMKELIFKILH